MSKNDDGRQLSSYDLLKQGIDYLENGENDLAIKCYQKAVDIKPDLHQAWNNIGTAYINKGEFGEAIKHYKKALKINPENEHARNNLALIEQTEIISQDLEESREEIQVIEKENHLDNEVKDILKEEIEELEYEKDFYDKMLMYSNRHNELLNELPLLEQKIEFKQATAKDYFNFDNLVIKIDDEYYKIALENIFSNKKLYENLIENIKKIPDPLIKSKTEELFIGDPNKIQPDNLKEWIELAKNEIDSIEIFRVIRTILTGLYITTTSIVKEKMEKKRILILSSAPEGYDEIKASDEVNLINKQLII